MSSKEAETFQKSVKHYHIAQSITMLILGIIGIIYFIFDSNLIYSAYYSEDYSSIYMNMLGILILFVLALFGMFIYTLVRYIQYLIALKVLCSLDPVDLFTKAYRYEMLILKIIIGGIITGSIALIFVFSGFSGDFDIYNVIYMLTIIPLSILIFLALFSRVYVEIIAFLLVLFIVFIDLIISYMKDYGSVHMASLIEYTIPVILVVLIFLIMGILIVFFQFKLNRVFFMVKQSIGIQPNLVKIKEAGFSFDQFHYLEFGIHIFAGIILLCILLVNFFGTMHINSVFITIGYLIMIMIYLSTAVIVFIGVKTWNKAMTADKFSTITTPSTTIGTQFLVYPRNESFTTSDVVNQNVIDQSSAFFMQCPRCGFKISDRNSKFCPICGQKVV